MIRPPRWHIVALVTATIAPGTALHAIGADDQAVRPNLRLQAVRCATPIVTDGRLDEEAWKTAPVAGDFVQTEPHQGEPATEQTEVRVLYDDEYLYIEVIAFDAEPERIIINDLKRDFDDQQADAFGFILDTATGETASCSRSTRGAPSSTRSKRTKAGR